MEGENECLEVLKEFEELGTSAEPTPRPPTGFENEIETPRGGEVKNNMFGGPALNEESKVIVLAY